MKSLNPGVGLCCLMVGLLGIGACHDASFHSAETLTVHGLDRRLPLLRQSPLTYVMGQLSVRLSNTAKAVTEICTAAIVGHKLILTAAHCAIDETTLKHLAGPFVFTPATLLASVAGPMRASGQSKKPVTSGTGAATEGPTFPTLDRPALGLADGASSIAPAVMVLRQAVAELSIAGNELSGRPEKLGPKNDWALMRLSDEPTGYNILLDARDPTAIPNEFSFPAFHGDLDHGTTPWIDLSCRVRFFTQSRSVLGHDCQAQEGASGAPLVSVAQGVYRLFAMHNRSETPDNEKAPEVTRVKKALDAPFYTATEWAPENANLAVVARELVKYVCSERAATENITEPQCLAENLYIGQ